MASCCASGPGSNMQKFKACRNRELSIQRFFSTNSACIMAIWPLGPPKEMNPSFSQNRNASANDGARCRSWVELAGASFICDEEMRGARQSIASHGAEFPDQKLPPWPNL